MERTAVKSAGIILMSAKALLWVVSSQRTNAISHHMKEHRDTFSLNSLISREASQLIIGGLPICDFNPVLLLAFMLFPVLREIEPSDVQKHLRAFSIIRLFRMKSLCNDSD